MGFWQEIKSLLTNAFSDEQEEESVELPLATAVLLIEIARSDMEITDPEIKVIREVLNRLYSTEAKKSDELIKLAINHVEQLTCLRDFTKAINEAFDESQKERLITALWQVAYADGVLDKHEEHWIIRLSELLYVHRSMVVKCKHNVEQSQPKAT